MPPIVAKGALWAGTSKDDNIWLWGGTTSYINTSFPGFQEPYPAQYSLWSFNTANYTWNQHDVTDGSPNRPSRGSSTFSKDQALGFYFNGQLDSGSSQETQNLANTTTIPLEGMIIVNTDNQTAQNVSTSAVVGDMPRTGGGLQYVSGFGGKGILFQIGGNQKHVNDTSNSDTDDLIPMDAIDVFDISTLYDPPSNITSGWYRQLATGDVPAPRVDFCIVYASATDGSSRNIYLHAGRGANGTAFDDVYVLSLPSFTWIKLYQGTEPRYGHTCHRRGRSMISIGGTSATDPLKVPCDDERRGVAVWDMSFSQWGTVFNANVQDEDYKVPAVVAQHIGGTKDGGATKMVPSYGFTQEGLATLFGAPASSVNSTDPFASPTTSTANSVAHPSAHISRARVALIAGTAVGGAVLLALLAVVIYIYRHHLKQITTGGPFHPPEVEGKELYANEAMAKEIFVELPDDNTRRVEIGSGSPFRMSGRVEMESPRGTSADPTTTTTTTTDQERSRGESSGRRSKPPMYPWEWI